METTSNPRALQFLPTMLSEKQSFVAQAGWITFFSMLTAVGAQIQIPHQPVPFTLQTFFVLLGAAFLGSRNGSLSQLLYLGFGLVGLPVFSAAGLGVARLFGPMGGYLLSFPVASLLVGYLVRLRRGYGWTLGAMFLGLVVIFACGATFLNLFYLHNLSHALANGFLIFSFWDVAKLAAAAGIYTEISKRYTKLSS